MEINRQSCAVTGETNNLTMHAFRNDKKEIIGWIFLSEEVSNNIGEYDIQVTVEWEKEFKPITGYCKNRIDRL